MNINKKIKILSNVLNKLGLSSEASHLTSLLKLASTYSMPENIKDSIALMTIDDFLSYRNPSEKHHESHSYDFDIEKLNRSYAENIGFTYLRNKRVSIKKFSNGISLVDGAGGDEKIIGVILDRTLYFKDQTLKNDLERLKREHIYSEIGRNEVRDIKLDFSNIEFVKYLEEYIKQINPVGKNNLLKFPHLIQNITVNNEEFSVRSEEKLETNSGTTIVVINSEGLIVAQASDEWGATLIVVAKEYRGHGLGKILGKIWYEENPGYKSGGFTTSGKRNAISIWKDKVSEFLSNGWYSELIKKQELSKEKLNKIISDWKLIGGMEKQKYGEPEPRTSEPSGEILIYSDGITFIIYDKSFLYNQDEKYIYGYGFLRSSGEKIFYYRIDYVNDYKELTIKVALQMAKDNNESIYNELPGDYIPTEGLEAYISTDNGNITVKKDLIELKSLSSKERTLRVGEDKFDEIKTLLFEMAESKDWPN